MAHAQTPPSSVSAAELEKLVGLLENDAERQRFVEQLKALVEAQRQTAPAEPVIPDRVAARFLGGLSGQVAEFGAGIMRAASFVADAPKLLAWIEQQAESEWSRQRLTEILSKVIAVLLGGWLAEWVALRLLGRARRTLETREIGRGWARAPFTLLHALVALVPILVFAIAAFAILGVIAPSRTASLVAVALINANLIARAIALVAWTVLAPTVPRLRLVPLGDENANYLYIWIRRLTNISIYGYFLAEAALLVGLPRAGHAFLLKLLGVVVSLLMVVLVLQNRTNVSRAILGLGQPSLLRRRLADLWHVLAVIYLLTVCFIWLVRPEGGLEFVTRATALTLVIVLAAWAVASLLRRLIGLLFRLTDDVRRRFPTLEVRANQYLQIVNVVVVVLVYGFAALSIFQAWGFGSLEWLATPLGRRVGASVVSIIITVVVALLMWEFVTALLDRYLARALGGGLDELRRAARVRTLMPLLQNVMLGVLAVFVVLVILSEIGVNIAPLLAGAGVVGIAVGFGAQTLAKDLISGISVILEDSIAVGDVVRLGDRSGVVEWMSLRSLRLRDGTGTVHWIPFGDVQIVSNMTKDFSYASFDLGVSYTADVDHVMAVMRRIAEEMRADPEFGPMIREDIEIWGVDQFLDSAVLIKARIKTAPGRQWPVTREYNRRIKKAFDAAGIEIPFPQRVVRVVDERKSLPGAAAS
ncbi:MAG TPA: mechanosensitive ion channel domain-containing protein [Alphaproteobacteria bacterium]|nr:mechanosensitive ion channel domain-containing protein [Alphaproteobacteria bacterium]